MARSAAGSPFVARAPQVDQLTLALPAAGEPAAVLVSGGRGRRQDPAAAARRGAGRGRRAPVVVGHCVDLGEIGLPYLPFAEALAQLRALDPDAVDAVVADRPALARLLPGPTGAAGAADDQAAGCSCSTAWSRRSAAVRAPGHPLLLVLEDLHWADASSRDVLRFLVSRLRDQHLVVVAQLPHRRPAPAAPVAAGRGRAGPAPARRAARPRAVHRRRGARVHHGAGRRAAGGAHAAAGDRAGPRATPTSPRSCSRPAPRPTSCPGRSRTCCARGSNSSTRRCSASRGSPRRRAGGCPSRCCAPS